MASSRYLWSTGDNDGSTAYRDGIPEYRWRLTNGQRLGYTIITNEHVARSGVAESLVLGRDWSELNTAIK